MRTIAAAIVLVGASPAFADTLTPTRVTAVQLQAGHDYAIEADGREGAFADLAQPDGHVLVHLQAQDSPDVGAEFRAPVSGTYHLRFFGDTGASIEADCAGSVRTRCALTPKNGGPRSFAWSSDSDWNRVSLRAGQSYTFSYHGTLDGLLVLHDSRGREVARAVGAVTDRDITLSFRAPRTGTYYVEAFNMDLDFAHPYTLGMR